PHATVSGGREGAPVAAGGPKPKAGLLLIAFAMPGASRSTLSPKARVSQELAHARGQRGELRGELHVLGDALGLIADHVFRRLRLRNGVLALDQLLQGNDVEALIAERLRGPGLRSGDRVREVASRTWNGSAACSPAYRPVGRRARL